MAALARQGKLAVFGEIKLDRGTLEQDFVDTLRAFHGQDVHRDRVCSGHPRRGMMSSASSAGVSSVPL